MKKIVALWLPLAMALTLAGCAQGEDVNTTSQRTTGNGLLLVAGSIEVQAFTIVAGDSGEVGAVSAVAVNNGTDADVLEQITVDGQPALLVPGSAPVLPGGTLKVQTGGEVTAQVPLEAEPGTYVEVSVDFTGAGRASGSALVVPAESFYESSAPTE